MSGLLTGILAARSVAGLLSALGGWSTVYKVAGVLMLGVALALWRQLPCSRNPGQALHPGAALAGHLLAPPPAPAQPLADRRPGLRLGERAVLDHGAAAVGPRPRPE
jgi:hypothetical protein